MRLPDSERSRAVLVGMSAYKKAQDFGVLESVTTNLKRLESFLREHSALQHVSTVPDPENSVTVLDALHSAGSEATDLLLFYYAGHAVPLDKDLGLTTDSSHRRWPDATTIAFDLIRREISASPAVVKVVILDCCYSGRAVARRPMGNADLPLLDSNTFDIQGALVLAATDGKTEAEAEGRDGCTAFTGELLDVLRTGHRSSDEFLTLDQTYQLLDKRLRQRNLPKPAAAVSNSAAHLALTINHGRILGTAVDADTEGFTPSRTLVRDSSILHDVVQHVIDGRLPILRSLNPYTLGVTPSPVGNTETHGDTDWYLDRTCNNVDQRLLTAIRAGAAATAKNTGENQLVLVTGPSKSGKTRTAFEMLRKAIPDALLVEPVPGRVDAVAHHPAVRDSMTPVAVWLDDLHRYLTHDNPITNAQIHAIARRLGPTVFIATIRTERYAELLSGITEPTRETRLLLERARTIELRPTCDDAAEDQRARLLYPKRDLSRGLAAHLAGAPALLTWYRSAEPIETTLVRVAIDWVRVGRPDPIPESVLIELTVEALAQDYAELEPTAQEIRDGLRKVRNAPAANGRVAALTTHPQPGQNRAYTPFDYLVAADDGQEGEPRRIPEAFWDSAIQDASPEQAHAVGLAAESRRNPQAAVAAWLVAAQGNHRDAMFALAYYLANKIDPPDHELADYWDEQAAAHPDQHGGSRRHRRRGPDQGDRFR
ncbi:caspase domain-containing protein [Nocardia sp. NPDC058640]|uniref:caspase family protein n=1 Tax=Nocardia sp. NPDC058640 TaxID=3346571 RepID=UPI003664D13F